MENSSIDDAILAAAKPTWRKVAMVIVTAADSLRDNLPTGEKALHTVAKRVEALVRDGRLTAQGDLKNWRHSEIKLPAPPIE